MDKKPVRVFLGNEGDKSIDDRGPDALKSDLDMLCKMFDPDATHDDGKQGGISTTNLRNGIFTDEKIGPKTVNDSIADPTADTGTFTQIMSWMAKQIKTVTGETDWKTVPPSNFKKVTKNVAATFSLSMYEYSSIVNPLTEASTSLEYWPAIGLMAVGAPIPAQLPAGPNFAAIGTSEDFEIVSYETNTGSALTGLTRGLFGTTAKAWPGWTGAGPENSGAQLNGILSAQDQRNDIYIINGKANTAIETADEAETKADSAVSTANTALGQDATVPYTGALGAMKIVENYEAAEGGRVTAETGRTTAEGVRVGNENTRLANEGNASSGRIKAELDRVVAESARVIDENTRLANEGNSSSGRIKAELDRVAAESARVIAETGRDTAYQGAEDARDVLYGTAETARDVLHGTAEGARNTLYGTAETARDGLYGTAETARDTLYGTAEGARNTSYDVAESTRNTAEGLRVTAEGGRVIAESLRVSSETSRVDAENARKVFVPYNAATEYVVGNKVSYLGSSYVCTANTQGNVPTDETYWLTIASVGAQGPAGEDAMLFNIDGGRPDSVYGGMDPVDLGGV